MQDKPTPGPWVVTEPADTDPYDDISIKAGPRTVCRIWQEGRTGSPINAEQWANARLIASAPFLLTALRALLEPSDVSTAHGATCLRAAQRIAREAIVLATGEDA
jgi:hypothetical protein